MCYHACVWFVCDCVRACVFVCVCVCVCVRVLHSENTDGTSLEGKAFTHPVLPNKYSAFSIFLLFVYLNIKSF